MDNKTTIFSAMTRRMNGLFSYRLGLIAVDAFMGAIAILCVIRWRYDFLNKPIVVDIDIKAAVIMALSVFAIWVLMRHDRIIWKFTSLKDFQRLFLGVIFACAATPLVLFFFFDRAEHFPRSAPFFGGFFFLGLIVATRLAVTIAHNGDIKALFRKRSEFANDAVLIGSSAQLYNYLRDMSRKRGALSINPIGLIDTSGKNIGQHIRNVPVMGGLKDIKTIYSSLTLGRDKSLQLISINPHMTRPETDKLVRAAAEIGAPLARTQSNGARGSITAFEASDLIGRELQALDISPVRDLIKGRRVLVTGAGGSIGSEISRQLVVLEPESLALYDNSEFNLYELEHSLASYKQDTDKKLWTSYIGCICDEARLTEVFEWERPDIVIHAAALKHVPLGELNPLETLRTNVCGTKRLLAACTEFETEHFILISTDKAVNPVNIMGASKRIVEMLMVATAHQQPNLNTAAVRFGNVLASNGSVVPLFEKQIAAGGPVTVTDPDVTRYFMTTIEASALVLQAAALEDPSVREHSDEQADIYVLEMGEPVNIAKLARQLIRLRGKVPEKDIAIKYTGLRPGEKLTEKLTGHSENLVPTSVPSIKRFTGVLESPETVLKNIDALLLAIETRNRKAVEKSLKRLLPNFKPNGALTKPPKSLKPD